MEKRDASKWQIIVEDTHLVAVSVSFSLTFKFIKYLWKMVNFKF